MDLSRLTEFVLHTLQCTDEVRNLLQYQCDEAKFVLTPWPLETISCREIDGESCSCVGILSSEDHVNEIASGIDSAVSQARRLREKLAINVLKEKKLAHQPSIQQIYAPSLKGTRRLVKEIGSKSAQENGCNVAIANDPRENERKRIDSENGNSCQKRSLSHKIQPGNANVTAKESYKAGKSRSCERDKKSVIEGSKSKKYLPAKRITDKKLVDTSPYNSLVVASNADRKSKGKKNFIAANKYSIKNIKPPKSKSPATHSPRSESTRNLLHAAESSTATKSLASTVSGVVSSADLRDLISRISLESDLGLVSTDVSLKGNGCPVHDINAPKYIEEKICTSVDAAEGLDRFGVPSELVKILKVYHSYLANSQSTNRSSSKRGEKAVNTFLSEFSNMNKARQKLSTRDELEKLCKDFLPVLKESCNKNMDFIELSKLKIRYTDLDTTSKSLQIRSLSPTKRKMSHIIENRCPINWLEKTRTWRSNAIWNEACIPTLEEIFSTRCMRYANKNQLLLMFNLMQRIQQLRYQGNLVDLLINEVIPLARNSLEPTSEEYAAAYKMVSIISNLLHMSVPVLVRTDK